MRLDRRYLFCRLRHRGAVPCQRYRPYGWPLALRGQRIARSGRQLGIRRICARVCPCADLRFLGGVGLAGVHMPGLNLLMDRVDRSHQGRAAGIYTSSYAAGSAVSFMIAGVVNTAFGWRATFVAAGIGPLLSIGACALLPRPAIENKSARPRPPYRALFRNRALIAYVAAFAGNT